MNRGKSLGPSETSLVIGARIEELNPQQVLARELLAKFGLMSFPEATAFVREIGASESSVLKEILGQAVDKAEALRNFRAAFHVV